VFVGSGSNIAGYFYAFDAKTGGLLWKFNTGAGVFSSPSVYMVNGEEFVTVASGGGDRGRRGGDLILSFALPKAERHYWVYNRGPVLLIRAERGQLDAVDPALA